MLCFRLYGTQNEKSRVVILCNCEFANESARSRNEEGFSHRLFTQEQIRATHNASKKRPLKSTYIHVCSKHFRTRMYSTFLAVSKRYIQVELCKSTPSLESLTLFRPISSSTSFRYQFLHFRLIYSFSYHFFLFCLTTLLIQVSRSLVHSWL